jgi:hypothetical protein
VTGRGFFSITALIVALAIIAVLWGMQLEAHRRLREQTESSQQLLARLNQLEVDNLRLSNAVVRANTPLSDVQLAELTQLRDEVRSLRLRTNDLQTLQADLRRLRAELSGAQNSIASNALPEVPPGDIYPRESWAFAGYDTPEAAVESVTWAISEGDEDTYLASLSPELRDEMESQLADGSFANTGPLELSNATGYRIVDRESLSENKIIVTLYMDADGSRVPVTLENTPNGWQILEDSGE